jgi:hypothetical protein
MYLISSLGQSAIGGNQLSTVVVKLGVTISHRNKLASYKMFHRRSFELGRILRNDLSNGKWTRGLELRINVAQTGTSGGLV